MFYLLLNETVSINQCLIIVTNVKYKDFWLAKPNFDQENEYFPHYPIFLDGLQTVKLCGS